MMSAISRRRLLTMAGAVTAAAATVPFPKVFAAADQVATPADLPAPAESQVLRWASSPIPRISVPSYGTDFTDFMLPNVYMTPFVQNSDNSFSPGICSDYTVSDDQLVYTLTMHPDAVWSDGTRITAHDIKYSWEWMANTTVSGNPFNSYQTRSVAGNLDVLEGKTTDMSGLVVLDDDTLQVTLSQPYAPFIYYCSILLMGVHQRANIENGGPDWDLKPTVASGPFMFETFDVNTGTGTLIRNPHWWGKQPTLERIEIILMPDYSTRLLAWEKDEIDVWAPLDCLPFLKQFGSSELLRSPGALVRYAIFDTRNAPMEDVHVRRALQRATDVPTLVNALMGDYPDVFVPATGISEPNDAGYIERDFLFDVDAAKAELAQSSYANATIPPIIITAGDNFSFMPIASILQQMWKDNLGIDLQVVPSDQASAADQEERGVSITINAVLYQGPGGILEWAWHDTANFTGFVGMPDSEVEALLDEGDMTPNEQLDARAAAYGSAEDLILERGYVIPLDWGPWGLFAKKRLINGSLDATTTLDVVNSYLAAD